MEQIVKTITQPKEVIDAFADNLGYQTVIRNEAFVPAEGSEQIQDPKWTTPEGFDPIEDVTPMVDNPDHVPAVGERMIDNPQTRVEFVSEKFDDMASAWFSQFAEKDARRSAEETIKATVAATKEAVKATIKTTI